MSPHSPQQRTGDDETAEPGSVRVREVRSAFDTADQAKRRTTTRYTSAKLRREARAVARLVRRLGPGPRIDVACGTGSLGAALHSGNRLVGVDAGREMVAAARHAAGYTAAVTGDATRLPFRSGAFAAGFSIRLLHHLDATGRRAVLSELRRVVDGPVIVSLFDAHTLEALRASIRRRSRGSRHAIPLADLAADAAATGWRLAAVSRKLWRLTEHVYVLLTPRD